MGSPGHVTLKGQRIPGAEAHFLPESYVKYYPSDMEKSDARPNTPSVPLRIHVERSRQVRYEVEVDSTLSEVDENELANLDAKRASVGMVE